MFKSEHQQKRPLENNGSMETSKRTRTGNEALEVGILMQHQEMGPVIGKGGENIKNIRNESGAQVHTSKFMPNVAERTAKIIGSAEQVASAVKMIIDTTGSKDFLTITLLAELMNCGFLIGKQGVTIKKVQDETSAEIQVSKECIGNSSQKQIRISGDYEAVSKAIDAVTVHLSEGGNPTRMTYVPGGIVNPPAAGRGWTLPPKRGFPLSQAARGGGGFQQQRFGGGGGFGANGGRPHGMPPGMAGNRGAGLGGGTSLMRIEMTLWIAKDLIGKIIGRGGSNVKAIRDQSTAHVFVHKDEEDTELTERRITIKGSKTAIDMAYSMIEELVGSG